MRISTLLESVAVVALLATSATGAMAQTINGGGSSLAGPTYLGEFAEYNSQNTSAPISFSYFTVGSGAAQTAFVNQTPSAFSLAAGSTIHFSASDAILPANLQTTWNSTLQATAGNLIQLPTIGTPITVPEAQVCGIFSGRINDVHTLNSAVPTGTTLSVVYRTDGSGTSFLLTQHLAAMCGTPTTASPITGVTEPVTFSATTNFAGLFTTLPANFIGGNTSSNTSTATPGVYQQVMSHSNVIAYLSPDYTRVAHVHATDTAYPLAASVTNRHSGLSVQPTWQNAQSALNTSTAGGIPAVTDPSTGYPIVGYTTWDVATCYSNSTIASELTTFLNDHYNDSFDDTIENNGFTPVSSAVYSSATTLVASIAAGHASGTACASLAGL
jgi:ABC-type phosphate transport system substrate-binding protein